MEAQSREQLLFRLEQERFLYPDSDEGRKQILLTYQAIIDEIDEGRAETSSTGARRWG